MTLLTSQITVQWIGFPIFYPNHFSNCIRILWSLWYMQMTDGQWGLISFNSFKKISHNTCVTRQNMWWHWVRTILSSWFIIFRFYVEKEMHMRRSFKWIIIIIVLLVEQKLHFCGNIWEETASKHYRCGQLLL